MTVVRRTKARWHMKSWIPAIVLLLFVPACGEEDSPTQAGATLGVIEQRGSITAQFRYDEVAAAAIALESSVRFKGVTGDTLSPHGTSGSWSYKFGMTIPPYRYYHLTAHYDSVRFDSTSNSTVGDAFITHAWMNSADAMAIAEAHGGGQFRQNHPDVTIGASLGEPVVPNPMTCWYITYRSTLNTGVRLNVTIDATTGIVQ
jgi:hypothetical protein